MDERLNDLQKDANGNIITNPLTGWTTVMVGGSSLLVAIQYVDHPEQFANGGYHQVQIVMTPEQALLIADQLRDFATRIAAPVPPGTLHQ